MKWYLNKHGNSYGPYTLAQLQAGVANGQVTPVDQVSARGGAPPFLTSAGSGGSERYAISAATFLTR